MRPGGSPRQSARQRPTEDESIARQLPDEPAPEGQVVLDDSNARLWACLQPLPERCQKLLRIVAAEARPDYGVVSEQLGMPVGSIGPTRAAASTSCAASSHEAGAS